VVVPADCYRASTTQSETRRCTPAAVAQVAEAAADARAVVSMLRLYVVCLLCFFQFYHFGTSPFLVTLLALVLRCISYTVVLLLLYFRFTVGCYIIIFLP